MNKDVANSNYKMIILLGGVNMKVRNEEKRKVIDIIDSRIERNKKSIITPGRGSAKTISIFAYNLSIMKANAALYVVKENIANSGFHYGHDPCCKQCEILKIKFFQKPIDNMFTK